MLVTGRAKRVLRRIEINTSGNFEMNTSGFSRGAVVASLQPSPPPLISPLTPPSAASKLASKTFGVGKPWKQGRTSEMRNSELEAQLPRRIPCTGAWR